MDFSLAQVFDAVAEAVPDRDALLCRHRQLSYAALRERARRLANHLLSRGLRVRRERGALAGHESGQEHLALYLYNGSEYVEGMLGAFMSRVAPLNVNYRYVEEELVYLLRNSGARAILYHAEFAPRLAHILPQLPRLDVLIQVADDSGNALLPGAVDYEEALAAASPAKPATQWSPDDLYILYTGGTTGMPKGVLWRSADIYVAAMGGRRFDGGEHGALDDIVAQARGGGALRLLLGPPLMHGAAQWALFMMLTCGHTVLFPNVVRHLDPDDFLRSAERLRATGLTIVGDAFAVPIIDQLAKGTYDLSNLLTVGSGGAPLSVGHKQKLLEHLPKVLIIDAIGSSETGAQGSNAGTRSGSVSTGDFRPVPGCVVVSADLDRVLAPEDDSLGWFAQKGRVPLGYLGDAEKTARTFPVIDGVRYSIPGDRARYRKDSTIDVLGRDSVTINSGGEKIFAEEVEGALKLHPAVYDAVVCGRPSDRWGQEVVAIVKLREGARVSERDLLDACAQHIARYKLPKLFLFRDEIVRSPSGKADYRWAKAQAEASAEGARSEA
jgi:acyl-CoA synthetase (AMP-forming)/AMP-acid ligase II